MTGDTGGANHFPEQIGRFPEMYDGDVRARPSNVKERATRVRFRRAVSLMVMTLLVPGSAQLLAGNRRVGRIALRVWFGAVLMLVGTLLVGLVWHGAVFYLVSNTLVLGVLRVLLMVAAIGWVLLFMDAWRLGQPLSLQQNHRLAVVGLNGFLSLTMAAVLLFGAHLVGVQRDFIVTMFGNGEVTGAHDGRFNVLMLGGDAGAGRSGLRPDSMTVASVDAETGRTVLVSLPRNMSSFPFRPGSVMAKQFPDGWNCDTCYLNAVSTWAMTITKSSSTRARRCRRDHPGHRGHHRPADQLLGDGQPPRVPRPGGRRRRGEAQRALAHPRRRARLRRHGLHRARREDPQRPRHPLVRPRPRGLRRLLADGPPEVRDERDAASDLAPTALSNFQDIAAASSEMVSTNLPAKELDRFMGLALKAKDQKISTVSLVPPAIITAAPDIALVHQMIADAITRAEGGTPAADTAQAAPATVDPGTGDPSPSGRRHSAPAAAKPKKQKGPAPVTGGSVGTSPTGTPPTRPRTSR